MFSEPGLYIEIKVSEPSLNITRKVYEGLVSEPGLYITKKVF